MDLTTDFKSFQDKVTSSLVGVTKTAGQISAEDLSFHRSSSGKLSKSLDAQNARLLQLTSKLLKAATKDTQVAPPKLRNQEDVEDKWRNTVDVIDDLLEKSDACLDEFTGVIKRLSPALQDGVAGPPGDRRAQKIPSIFSSHTMRKPQILFQRPIANDVTARFKPLLRTKPNALVSLEQSVKGDDVNGYKHPYAIEIEQSSYSPDAYKNAEPTPFTSPTESQAIFVDTEEAVNDMLKELRKAKEIAVDLEHHDTHSYVGIVSLMQISTRSKDWIVDTLKPWRENLQVLNEVFTDPKILKVFHGSHEDMVWLQRDLGLYVVGLFDTYYACVALNFEGRGLKYLLKRFADFDAQKKYQLADWRVRPLPDDLIDYARSDTHYLLYIYDNLRNMLLAASTADNNLMDYVCTESKKEASQRFERFVYDFETGLGSHGWYNSLMKRTFRFSKEQLAVYRALHQWRDVVARELDEGLPYIMTAAQLFAMSEAMPLSVPALMGCVRPITKAITDNARKIVEIIKKAKDEGAVGPTVMEIMKPCQEKLAAQGVRTQFWKPPKDQIQQRDVGVGATVQMLLEEKQTKPVTTRSQSSTLWGSILSATVTAEPSLPDAAVHALRMLLPLPNKSDISFVDQSTAPVAEFMPFAATAQVSTTNTTSIVEKVDQETFVIRDSGRRKKRKAIDDLEGEATQMHALVSADGALTDQTNLPPTSPAVSIEEIDTEVQVEKKAQHKAERRLRKEQRAAAAAEQARTLAQAEPFDYATAESVLHAKPVVQEKGAPEPKGTKRPFNPNQKALDTSTGMKRARKEESGKSFTFKK